MIYLAQSQAIRKKKSVKRYGLIFVCQTSRAIHLELVTNKEAKSILAAFQRFAARRGTPRLIISDNEKSFRQMAGFLKDLGLQVLANRAVIQKDFSVEWTFNPPLAAWWGGFYERLIGVTKSALRAFRPQRAHTDEELFTMLVQVEAFVNSRPLLRNDKQVDFLTPAHLVLGHPLIKLAPVPVSPVESLCLAKQYSILQRKINAA